MERRMRGLAAIRRYPLFQSALVIGFVYAAIGIGRELGVFEPTELLAYDMLVRLRAATSSVGEAPVVIVGADETDLNRWGWPLPDGRLAEVIERLAALEPRAVGIDLFRDQPRPPGQEELRQALLRHQNVILAFRFDSGDAAMIPPPEALRGSDRTGFADVLVDRDGIVRRGLLFLDDGATSYASLPLRLVLEYLRPEGIDLAASPETPEHLRLGRTSLPPFEANDGGYVRADDRGYQILLDYRHGDRPLRQVTLSQLLDGAVPLNAVRGKIVILGVNAESVKDFFYTPFSRRVGENWLTYGDQLHGLIAAQLLRHALHDLPPTRPPPALWAALWILAWSAAGGALGYTLRSPSTLAAGLGGGVLVLGLGAGAAFAASLWLPVISAGAGWVASATLVTALISRQEKAQRELLMQIFARNVSPEIAEAMWRQRDAFMEGGRPRPQRLVATVLFTDLRGFTTISETHDPQELMEWLDTYMETMTNVVLDHGGVLDKFIGDAIMAVFGVPIARTTPADMAADAVRAVDCALAMAGALARLNARWRKDGQPLAQMRVGIFTGPVVAGTLGSARRMNYTVVGDTVNTAARLESFDKAVGADLACRILIGEPTLAFLHGRYAVRPVGEQALKGKMQKLPVYLVDGRVLGQSPPVASKESRYA
jgi:adenylate cyclase